MWVHKKCFVISIVILAIVLSAANIKKPKILIIGDSISGGYTPFVKDYFKDKAIVAHNPGNAGHSGMVNDIYKESIAIHKKNGIGSDDVHYKEEGNEQLSKIIIDYLNGVIDN